MFLSLIENYKKLASFEFEKIHNDDFIDKLSRKYSTIMMVMFSFILGISQLVGKPLSCWCPKEYSGSRCEYGMTYCYLTSFYVPVGNNTFLPRREELESHKILYYQWIAYIFLFQALLFYFPSIIWSFLSTKSGFDLKNYVEELRKSQEHKLNAYKYVATHIKECTLFGSNYKSRNAIKKNLSRFSLLLRGVYLSLSYIFVKCLYALVAFGQLLILNYWFRDDYHRNKSLTSFIFGEHNNRLLERFPRMTLCKFQVYILNDQQTHWMQCTLPMNIYIEKMYLIVWYWSVVLFFLTIANLLRYLFVLFIRDNFISKYIADEKTNNLGYLKADDILVLRLIRANTSTYDITKLAKQLNKIY